MKVVKSCGALERTSYSLVRTRVVGYVRFDHRRLKSVSKCMTCHRMRNRLLYVNFLDVGLRGIQRSNVHGR